jgi:hypothetical protein
VVPSVQVSFIRNCSIFQPLICRNYLELNEEAVGEQPICRAMVKDFAWDVFNLEANFFVNQGKNLLEILIN